MDRSGSSGGVLCRYFFQGTFDEHGAAPPEQYTSSLLLSNEPTLDELRRKFPFEGQYHFRLQHPLPALASGKPTYCWLDLREPHHVLPVTRAPQSEIRVKVLQLSPESPADDAETRKRETGPPQHLRDDIDVPEDRRFDAYFRPQLASRGHSNNNNGNGSSSHSQQQQQDVASVLSGVKKALASKMKQSAMAQSIQKQSAKMWDKVLSTSSSNNNTNAPPTAAALAQLAKLISAMKAPLHESSREHVDLLNRLWVASGFDAQAFTLRGSAWERLGLNYGDPMRELQCALPLHCLVFFHEVHQSVALPMLARQSSANPQSYPYALVSARVAFLLADVLQLRDGACLGLERPFWRLFEDPIAFFELFSLAFRAFDASWALHASASREIAFHLDYVADFAHELLLRRSPESVGALVECAHQMQNW